MRIIRGTARGRRILNVPGHQLRPATNRVRTAQFNILADAPDSASVLDLFAGTGSLGLEALSRGAAHCVFVDKDPRCVTAIKRTVQDCGFDDCARVIRADVFRFERKLPTLAEMPFELVFVAPPYALMEGEENRPEFITFLGKLLRSDALSEESIIVLESRARTLQSCDMEPLGLYDQRKYGGTEITFLKKPPVT